MYTHAHAHTVTQVTALSEENVNIQNIAGVDAKHTHRLRSRPRHVNMRPEFQA